MLPCCLPATQSQDNRISVLCEQLDQLSSDVIALQVSANTAAAAACAHKARAGALAAQLEAAVAERSELAAQLAAALMEAGGTPGGSGFRVHLSL